MLVLPIIAFAIELILNITANALTATGGYGPGFAWFTIITFVICLIIGIVCIVKNAKELKWATSKAKLVTGLVFSIAATSMGLLFVIGVIIGFAAV